MNLRKIIAGKIVGKLVEMKLSEIYAPDPGENEKPYLSSGSKSRGRSAKDRRMAASDESPRLTPVTPADPSPADGRAGRRGKFYGKRVERMMAIKKARGESLDDSED